MAQDKNGNVLMVGDRVLIAAIVKAVCANDAQDKCANVLVRLEVPLPEPDCSDIHELHSSQVELDARRQGYQEALEVAIAQNPRDPLLTFFRYAHLPERLRQVSLEFACLAMRIVATLPSSAERTVALRKLLESKDCAVRAAL